MPKTRATDSREGAGYAEAERHIKTIVSRLRDLDPRKIILFGSHAWGRPGLESDLDVMVVLKSRRTPNSFSDRNKLYQAIVGRLRDVQEETPLDVIVQTESMHEQFLERDSMFARKVIGEGRVLYEARG